PDESPHRGRLFDDVVAQHRARPAGRLEQGGQDADDGRLAGPVGAEEAVDLTLGDLEADTADSLDLAEPADQVSCLDCRHAAECRGSPRHWQTNSNSPGQGLGGTGLSTSPRPSVSTP